MPGGVVMAVEIVCVIDHSGSMGGTKGMMAVDGFNEFVMKQKGIEGYAELTLGLFNSGLKYVCQRRSLELVAPLDYQTLCPGGGTAITKSVNRVLRDVMTRRGEHDHVVFMVLTDGDEGWIDEDEIQPDEVKKLVAKCEDEFDWSFLFVSVDRSGPHKAKELGFRHCHRFKNSGEGMSRALSSMNDFSSLSRTGGVD